MTEATTTNRSGVATPPNIKETGMYPATVVSGAEKASTVIAKLSAPILPDNFF
ncbi:hypothetical protein D3C76_1597010 [compost metagenome]